ncbi:Zinc finger, C2H2 type family protein [Histomonas meleagridis]|uniref:zinc finger protein, C2H2 type family protein n=1 Tax=Histomonas meleagridis TaxID=135588 RepID=UPI00355A28FF|nr:Zinc finger, C2H2 type family protein [Histomonas meleagridis]KAH0801946.1 zinc finger protein, C2H2 type family protein [Histomonas meleagridis]
MSTVHKEILKAVPNALPDRESPDNSVFGMKGIPESVYLAWRSSVDPEFKERTKDVNLDAAFYAGDATRFAALNNQATASNITFNQFNQFQRANVHVNPSLTAVVTAHGVVTSDSLLQKGERSSVATDVAKAQRRYEIAMQKAQKIINEAIHNAERERKRRTKERAKNEELYFTPENGLSVFEMRAMFLAQQNAN